MFAHPNASINTMMTASFKEGPRSTMIPPQTAARAMPTRPQVNSLWS